MSTPVERPVSTCPVCQSIDQVQRVSTVLDTGASTTNGSAVTQTYHGRRTTQLNATTENVLVARFRGPARPDKQHPWAMASLFFLILLFVLGPFIGAAAAAITALVFALLAGIGISSAVPEIRLQQAAWDRCQELLRQGYHCPRDDTSFAPGATAAQSPEEFVRLCFAEFRRVLATGTERAKKSPATNPGAAADAGS